MAISQAVGHRLQQGVFHYLLSRQIYRHLDRRETLVQPGLRLSACGPQYPSADREDQAGIFERSQKASRSDQAAIRMPPPQQCLDTGDLAGLRVPLRLVVQDDLTTDVISALRVELAPSERDVVTRRPTTSVAAYDAYLQGIEAHGHRTEEPNLIAKGHFRDAIQLDPAFSLAYTGLALSHSRDAVDGWVTTPLSSLERAAELVEIAAAIDPSLPQVYFVSAQVGLFRKRHVQAIEAAELAIRAYPNYADAYALLAWILNYAVVPTRPWSLWKRP